LVSHLDKLLYAPGNMAQNMENPGGKTGPERGWVFGLVIAPVGVLMQGMVQGGVLGYLLSRQGTGSAVQAHVIGLLSLPTSLYFLWSPITDFFVRRRTWLLGGSLTAALLMWLSFKRRNSRRRCLFTAGCSSALVMTRLRLA
jgi:MFS transporter, PAT family, beta-lactamase induction signal transducer AmpG